LVKECGVSIDEAALHESAFKVENTLREMDKNLITDDIIPNTSRGVKAIKNSIGDSSIINSDSDVLSLSPDKKIKFEDRDRSRANNYEIKDTTVNNQDLSKSKNINDKTSPSIKNNNYDQTIPSEQDVIHGSHQKNNHK